MHRCVVTIIVKIRKKSRCAEPFKIEAVVCRRLFEGSITLVLKKKDSAPISHKRKDHPNHHY